MHTTGIFLQDDAIRKSVFRTGSGSASATNVVLLVVIRFSNP